VIELSSERLRERGELVERSPLGPETVVELRDAILRRALGGEERGQLRA
jgi:hypothetical protein